MPAAASAARRLSSARSAHTRRSGSAFNPVMIPGYRTRWRRAFVGNAGPSAWAFLARRARVGFACVAGASRKEWVMSELH